MIDKETARVIASAEINRPQPYENPQNSRLELVILDEYVQEEDFGWVFPYQSKRYVETDEMSYALAGNSSLIVSRQDGSLHFTDITGSRHKIDHTAF